jgi:hypothetical protein
MNYNLNIFKKSLENLLTKILKYVKYNYKIILFIFITYILVIFSLKLLKFNTYDAIDHVNKIIIFGQTCDLTNNEVSKDYALGFQLAFNYINNNGGVNGYVFKIVLLDDKYEPNICITNAKMLVDYYNVLALIGSFGTPTSVGIIDEVIRDRNIPLIAPFSAGTSYRKYFNKYLILMNTDFYAEFKFWTKSLIEKSYKNISIIYQNDIYGNFFYNSYVDYILENNLPFNIVSSGHYERNSNDLDGAFKSVFGINFPYNYNEYNFEKIQDIQAVIIFAAEKQISSILGKLKRINPNITIYYNFFVGTKKSNLKYLTYENKDNIYQSLLSYNDLSHFPELNNLLSNEIKTYNDNNVKKIEEMNSTIISGFYNGLTIYKVLSNFKDMKKINRETFTDMFYEMKNIDVFGLPVGPFIIGKNNEGISYAEFNKLQNNLEFKEIENSNKNIQ